jgi:hypothetical protein
MLRRILLVCFITACFGFSGVAVSAQEVIHALTGTVSAVDPTAKTISVFLDTGSEGEFSDLTNGKIPSSFDKKLRLVTTAVDESKKKGAYVIVFYFGGSDTRTAVALRNLGAGPFTSVVGTVSKFESHGRSISVQDESGAIQTFKLDESTVAEGGSGATEGLKFDAQKGDRVRIVGSSAAGGLTALFVRAM